MIIYIFLLFYCVTNSKINNFLNYQFKNIDEYDNRNLTIPYNDISNLTIIFNKYKILKKIESNDYNIYTKLEMLNYNNIIINPFNILNGGLLEDWEFN